MVGLFKFLFWVILIYYIIKLFTKYLLPVLWGNYFSKKVSEMQKQQRDFEQKEEFTSAGSTFIQKPSTKSKDNDFTDYEEIE